jgi:hypothetical protein
MLGKSRFHLIEICSRVCRHSPDREQGADEANRGGEAGVCFVVARSDAAEFLEALEEVLDEMPPFVHFGVIGNGRFAVRFGRDDGGGAALVQRGAQGIVVEGFVPDEGIKIDACDQRLDTDAVVALTRQQDKAHQIAERIDKSDDLGRQSATRLADGLIVSPPFAPVPCR